LKAVAGAARTEIVAAKFFVKFLVAVDHAQAALDSGFGWEALAALTGALERIG
jgi:hypothetical protein